MSMEKVNVYVNGKFDYKLSLKYRWYEFIDWNRLGNYAGGLFIGGLLGYAVYMSI